MKPFTIYDKILTYTERQLFQTHESAHRLVLDHIESLAIDWEQTQAMPQEEVIHALQCELAEIADSARLVSEALGRLQTTEGVSI